MGKKRMLALLGALFLTITMAFNPLSGMGAEKYVSYLALIDFTGPTGSFTSMYAEGVADYIKYWNDQGGADGVKLKPIFIDARYDASRAVSAYQKYRKEPKLMFVYSHITSAARVLYPLTFRDKIALQTGGAGYFQHLCGWAFTHSPTYQDGFSATLDWMVEDWKKKGNPGKPVVGYIAWDNPYGREHLLGGREYAEKIGVKLLPPEFFPQGSLKHDVWLTRLENQGANYIFVAVVDPEASNTVRDAYALGMTKKIQFVSDIHGTTMETGVTLHPEELEGLVIVSNGVRGSDDAHNHQFSMLWKKYGKSKPTMQYGYMTGVGYGIVYTKALKLAVRDAGYEKIDGEAYFKALLKLTGEDTMDIMGKVDLSPTSRRITNEVKFYRVKGGKMVPISGWVKCPDAVSLHKW
ncbi:MAG: ABC transporter substrate-binding protein [Thermodesulfobacteriota bacterium]|jgi:ABC-type branched-subunit amino acid transport system substrate-binding protein